MMTLVAGSEARAEIDVKKSRFIAVIRPVKTEEEARAAINAEKARYPDARHHCSAFVVQVAEATNRAHFSDDGEPAGTAGAPMLEVIESGSLVNVVAVVTRYFGGTLLGTGGLVRAYSAATQSALGQARLARIDDVATFSTVVDPSSAGKIEAELRRRGWTIDDVQWANIVTIRFSAPPQQAGDVEAAIPMLTSGRSAARRGPDRSIEVPVSS